MPVINFVKEKKKVEVPEGANLRKEARKAGVQVYPGIHQVLHCPGMGLCGSCRVMVVNGEEDLYKNKTWYEKLMMMLNPFTFFGRLGNEKKLRLACQTKVTCDIDVETQPPMNWHGEKYWA